ncbi:MAG: PEP-CTERM sorting domain-containing protein [Fimbriimonadaceae bacterium]
MKTLTLCIALAATAGANALTLTGLNGTPTDANGDWHTGWYNTYGPEVGKNAYIAMDSLNGAFLNSGNGPSTLLSIDLSQPGVHRLYAFFDGNEIFAGRDYWGLNLFFNGSTESAGISAFGRPKGAGDADPSFWTNAGQTRNLPGNRTITAANSLLFQDGSLSVSLTKFSTDRIEVHNLDRVGQYALGANGRLDHVVEMELTVVPEPATLAALGFGLTAVLRRRKRSTKNV